MFEIIKGSLLCADADAICQQVNCRNAMGSGLAKAIYEKWPIVKTRYHELCGKQSDMADLLGDYQIIKDSGAPFDIVNIFGQLDYGRDEREYTNYVALVAAFIELNSVYAGKTVAFPYLFGCGLAGGDWTIVESLILRYFTDCNVKIYKL